jgi:hypothetical protein
MEFIHYSVEKYLPLFKICDTTKNEVDEKWCTAVPVDVTEILNWLLNSFLFSLLSYDYPINNLYI